MAFNLYPIPTHAASLFAASRPIRTDSKTRAVPDFRRIYWRLTAFAQSHHQISFPVSAVKQRLARGTSHYLFIECHDVFEDLWHGSNFTLVNSVLPNLSIYCWYTLRQEFNYWVENKQAKQTCFPPEGAEDILLALLSVLLSSLEGRLLNLTFKQMIQSESASCVRIILSQKFNSLISLGTASAGAVFRDTFRGQLVWVQF